MKTSHTFVSLRSGNAAVLPFFAFVDLAPDVLATCFVTVVAFVAVLLSFVFVVRRPSPNHQAMLDLVAHLGEPEAEQPPKSSARPTAHRMRA